MSESEKTLFAKSIAIILTLAMVIITQTSCSSKKEPVSDEAFYLDTTCQLSVYDMKGGMTEKKAKKAIDEGFDTCRRLDKELSNTVETSDISRINSAGGQWVAVGEDALKVIKAGIEYGKISDGAFDITIGRVTELWNFQSDNPVLPDGNKLADALNHVDYTKLEVDGANVRLTDPYSKIDLGGIAKGYIGDRVADKLKECGVTSGIVNLGGNVIAIGDKPGGRKFRIGIEKPFSDRSETVGSVDIEDKTVVTSGVYERQFKLDGKIYYHVLDVRTGYPIPTDLDSATLLMDYGHSMDADAMSTICLMKGANEAKRFIENRGDVRGGILCLHNGEIIKTHGVKLNSAE